MARKEMTEEEAMAAAMALTEKENKKVRKRPDSTVQTMPGDNAKYTAHNLMLFRLKPVSFESSEEIEERTETYFEICQQNDMKPSVAGYALALGIDRKSLWRIITGETVKPNDVRHSLKRAYLILNAQMEDYMQNGKINPVSGIFLMKNSFQYQDKQEIQVSASQGDAESPDQLASKYADAIPANFTADDDAENGEK
jgi:hypothetical protein